jgi:hypothetical protein
VDAVAAGAYRTPCTSGSQGLLINDFNDLDVMIRHEISRRREIS